MIKYSHIALLAACTVLPASAMSKERKEKRENYWKDKFEKGQSEREYTEHKIRKRLSRSIPSAQSSRRKTRLPSSKNNLYAPHETARSSRIRRASQGYLVGFGKISWHCRNRTRYCRINKKHTSTQSNCNGCCIVAASPHMERSPSARKTWFVWHCKHGREREREGKTGKIGSITKE